MRLLKYTLFSGGVLVLSRLAQVRPNLVQFYKFRARKSTNTRASFANQRKKRKRKNGNYRCKYPKWTKITRKESVPVLHCREVGPLQCRYGPVIPAVWSTVQYSNRTSIRINILQTTKFNVLPLQKSVDFQRYGTNMSMSRVKYDATVMFPTHDAALGAGAGGQGGWLVSQSARG